MILSSLLQDIGCFLFFWYQQTHYPESGASDFAEWQHFGIRLLQKPLLRSLRDMITRIHFRFFYEIKSDCLNAISINVRNSLCTK